MKKLFILSLLFILLSNPAIASSNTLYEFFNGKLPSIEDRAKIAFTAGINGYVGTYSQNVRLLAWLTNKSDKLGSNIPSSGINWSLSTPISSTDTIVYLTAVTDIRGNVIAQADLPTKVYLTIEPNSTSNAEIIVCPSSGYVAATKSFSSCTRGLSFSGSSETTVAANKKTHASGSTIVMSNVGQFFNNFVDIDSAQTVGGVKTFTSFPITPSSAPTTNYQVSNKKYVDDTISTGVADATETVAGKSELATGAEAAAGTSIGGTGSRLVLPGNLASSTPTVSTNIIPVTGSNGKLSDSFTDFTLNKSWSGTNTHSGLETFTNGVSITGTTTISASSTTTDPLILNGIKYKAPATQASSTALTTDGSGGLTWSTYSNLLYATSTVVSIDNSTKYNTIGTTTVPANFLGTNKIVRIKTYINEMSIVNSGWAKFTLRYGNVAGVTVQLLNTSGSTNVGSSTLEVVLMNNNSTSSQTVFMTLSSGVGAWTATAVNNYTDNAIAISTLSTDSTVNQPLAIVAQTDPSSNITSRGGYIELLR